LEPRVGPEVEEGADSEGEEEPLTCVPASAFPWPLTPSPRSLRFEHRVDGQGEHGETCERLNTFVDERRDDAAVERGSASYPAFAQKGSAVAALVRRGAPRAA